MKNFQRNTLLSAINLALIGIPNAQAADSQALERRIHELESRLKKFEALESRLEKFEAANNKVPPAVATPAVDTLTQKINTLERKLEVQDEITTANNKKAPKIEAGANGFKISSPDGDYSVRLRASVQTDGRFFMDDSRTSVGATGPSGLTDRFEVKQARLWVEGRLWKYIDYKIMPDFGGGKLTLADAYFDAHYFPYASLSVGKQKTPLSLERLQGDSDGTFLERASPTYLASNRDVGVMLHGEFAKSGYSTEYGGPVDFKNFLSYQVGIFDGAGDNGSVDTAFNDNKEVVARIFAQPFQHSGIDFLEGLGIGVAGSYEKPQERPLNNLPSALGSNTIVNGNAPKATTLNATNTTAVYADGKHYRLYPQAYWYYGPFGLLGEYVLSSQELVGKELDSTGKTVRYTKRIKQLDHAWQIQASYVLTGEDNTFQSVKPIRAFDPFKGNWGAWQIAARWTELGVDKNSFSNVGGTKNFQLFDPAKSVDRASAWTVGLNWFLNNNVRVLADYEQTHFNGGATVGNRPTEKVFATRFQLVF